MKPIINVAVVDDQYLFRECFIKIINNLKNINVILEAENGKELIDKISAGGFIPDVILLDLDMPVMNGVETTKKLHALFGEVKIVILSIHEEQKYIAKMTQLGINGYLAKNAPLAEVEKAITAVYYNGYYFNETLLSLLKGTAAKSHVHKATSLSFEFSKREVEILNLICLEYTTTEIAEKLFISERTVDGHRRRLLEKTESKNTAGLVIFAIRNQLFDIDEIVRKEK